MTELVERLSAATVGSRELDAAVNLATCGDRERLWGLSGMNAQREAFTERDLDNYVLRYPREHGLSAPVTTSLDAALALAERVLPGCCVLVADYKGAANMALWNGEYQYTKGWCSLSLDDDAASNVRTYAHTPALALCIAILKALAAQASDTAGGYPTKSDEPKGRTTGGKT